jgi:hypothetical protein
MSVRSVLDSVIQELTYVSGVITSQSATENMGWGLKAFGITSWAGGVQRRARSPKAGNLYSKSNERDM